MSAQTTTEFRVSGMSCDGCAARLTNVLRQTEGVESADVSFADKRARVTHDTTVSRDSLLRRIEAAGFAATAP